MKIWYFVNNNTYILPPQPTYLLPPQIKNIAKYIWLCPPPLLCLLHINVTFTQSPTTPHWPCKVHTHTLSTNTNSPISIHNKYISHNDTHTTTPPHNHPHPHAHTPTHPTLTPHTHLHTYTTPNTLICTPSPHKRKTLHYNIFKVSNLLQYTYCIAVPLQLLSTNTWTLP